MIKLLRVSVTALILAWAGSSLAAAPAGGLESANVNLGDQAALQRGAALYMNYCAGCHSLGLQRYSRTAEDLGLTEDQVMQYLNFTGAQFGGPMLSAMDPADGEAWFGKAPPDLSLVARSKLGGPDWTYNFLKSFYVDETRPTGWNNTILPNASMPNVLWEMQGVQEAVMTPGANGTAPVVERFEVTTPGRMTAEQFDRAIRDITAFLHYVGEPAALKRETYGLWVILFLAAFTFLAWLLKTEYWRDVH